VADVDTTAEEIDESTAAEPEGTVYDGTLGDEALAPTPSRWRLRRLLVPIVLAVFFLGSAGMASCPYLTDR
jgi:hypothetical protein